MMFTPALAAGHGAPLSVAAWDRSASAVAAVLIGNVIATYPFWGPSLDEGMRMLLDWIGTILAHYVASAIVLLGSLLQLLALMWDARSRFRASRPQSQRRTLDAGPAHLSTSACLGR
jgi:hypothetical protein